MKNILRILQPLALVFSFLMTALGVGVARYLGAAIDGALWTLALSWLWAGQIGTLYLSEYARLLADPALPKALKPGTLTPGILLMLSAVFLTIVASLTVLIFQQVGWQPALFTMMAVILAAGFLYAAPPRYLHKIGLGEVTAGILLCNLVPALAFLLFSEQSLRLIAMSTFPLTALYLALQVIVDLSTYAVDNLQARATLVMRMGWPRGMDLHNLLIFCAFLFLVLAAWMGMPFAIVWPTFLLLPLGLWQVWRMIRIAAGAKPNWRVMAWGAQLLLGIMAYLLAYGFWIR